MKELERYAYFGHYRAGSSWVVSILNSICEARGFRFVLYHKWAGDDINHVAILADINAELHHKERIRPHRGFHVIRDPRDIVISAYFSHLHSHALGDWLVEQRRSLASLDQDEGILATIDFRSKQFRRMSDWNYSDPNILEAKFEDLIEDSASQFNRILEFLDLGPRRLGRNLVETILRDHTFRRLSGGRSRGEEKLDHHYRSGTPGDWRRYFSDKNKEYFKERYGQLVIDLGYEPDSNW